MRTAAQNFSALALAVGLSACTCGGPPPCKSTSDCGGSQVCLEIQSCAPACSTDGQCVTGEKCSSAGGCVASTGCGADKDCSADTVCIPSGTCAPRCQASGCGSGEKCAVDGHCVAADADAGTSCGGELFQSTRVQANMLVVLDQSGSMMDKVAGKPKWTSAVDAVKQVTAQHDSEIRFGLHLFSTPTMKCDPGTTVVPVGDNQAQAIAAGLPPTAAGNGTPIAAALQTAVTDPSLADATRANYVLLVTDGEENCNGNPVDTVKQLASQGVKTYVVGFGGEVDVNGLSQMAIEGGTARQTTPRYYQADNATDLQQALAVIAQGAIGCDYKLAKAPPDPSKVFVYINGGLTPNDPSKANGWAYDAASTRLTLYGPTCDFVSKNPGAKVSIVYGCPDGVLIEGDLPKDGGVPDFGDGGITIN